MTTCLLVTQSGELRRRSFVGPFVTLPLMTFRPRAFSGFLSFLAAAGLAGCNLQKDIDIPQPAYEEQLVVECTLIPGEPYQLAVQRTRPYGAPLPQPTDTSGFSFDLEAIPTDAVVVISGPRGTDTLYFSPFLDITTAITPRGYTHFNPRPFDGLPGESYSLLIYDGAGHRVTGTTTVLAAVPIDTVEVSFDPRADPPENAKAGLLTRYHDPASPGDTYRYQTSKVSRGRLDEQQSFEFDDRLINGRPSALGSSYRFSQNDTIDVALYRISRAYFDYLNSVDAAQGANGNPFAQPAAIKSTVQGGIGVFTSLAGVHKRVILKR